MTNQLPPPASRPRQAVVHRTGRRAGRRGARTAGPRGRRWPRRLLLGVGAFGLAAVVAVAGVFFYARYRFDKIHKVTIGPGVLAANVPGQPFDILLVGSDSRAFVHTAQQASAFGSSAAQTGQRSDVIIVARVVPKTRQIKLLSIPRDTWVDIPGTTPLISGPNKINVAFNSGPQLLIQTIEHTFHVPITYFVGVNFPAFSGMVGALGGIYLDFRYPVKDAFSGLDITTTGCQLVGGAQALGLVRSRHLYWYANGQWNYDGLSDLSRIQRQDAFFRSVVSRLKSSINLTSLPTLNKFLTAATGGLEIDQTLSESEILSLAKVFRGFSSNELVSQTLPTAPYVEGIQDVLLPVAGPDNQVLSQFLAFGSSPSTAAVIRGPGTTDATLTSSTSTSGSSTSGSLTSGSSTSGSPGSVTVNTIPGTPVITNPAAIDYNTQPEPWNPTTCTP